MKCSSHRQIRRRLDEKSSTEKYLLQFLQQLFDGTIQLFTGTNNFFLALVQVL